MDAMQLAGLVYLVGVVYVVRRVAPTLKRWAGGDQ